MLSTTSLLLAAGALPAAWAQLLPPTPQACSPLHFIFARATTEPPTGVEGASPEEFESEADKFWSKGYGAAGYSIFDNVTTLIPDATGYPVHYPASFLPSSPDQGVEDLINHITSQAQECPDQKFALGGHSQGGVVTVDAIPQLPEDVLSRIIAVTMVGSPDCPPEVDDRCRSYCNEGDFICSGGLGGGFPGLGGGEGGFPGLGGIFGGNRRRSQRLGMAASRIKARQDQTQKPPDCSGPEPPEKGHEAQGSLGAHLAYNEDGFYVYAAACYILHQYEAASGAS